jgi:hypothetical protein
MSAEQRYFVGLDLGQACDFTALAILERRQLRRDDPPAKRRPVCALRHLQRFPPGTGYPAVVERLLELLRNPALPKCDLLVDQTGAGRAAVNLVIDAVRGHADCTILPITISAGHTVERVPGHWMGLYVPKKELVGTVQVLLQTRRLQIPRTLPDATLLVRELENFRTKVLLDRHATVEAWREGQHDDLVFAVALAAWMSERSLPVLWEPPPEPTSTRLRAW